VPSSLPAYFAGAKGHVHALSICGSDENIMLRAIDFQVAKLNSAEPGSLLGSQVRMRGWVPGIGTNTMTTPLSSSMLATVVGFVLLGSQVR